MVAPFSPSGITPAGIVTVVHAFTAFTGGYGPNAALIQTRDGTLYGTTSWGAINGNSGTVFQLIPDANRAQWKVKILHSFCSKDACRDGVGPESRLTYAGAADGQLYDGVSPLYGTAYGGGKEYGGVAFELSPIVGTSKWTYRVLHDFCDPNTCTTHDTNPFAGMTMDRSGNLIGATSGKIFQLTFQPDRDRWKEIYLYDGGGSRDELTLNAAGNFFGISNNVAFKLVPKGKHSKFIPLYTFCSNTCEDCLDPSGVAMDESGNLFGTAYLGGNEWDGGTVWELSGTNLQVLHTFCEGGNTCKDGKSPMALVAPVG